ncbi:alpha-mannosidase [Lederbergia galactosidilytica]|uniref:Alpha-mannosidase n=1 Tax=Lederbergia galactosidilytica TaxID=217031 RepID=A0A177ZU45_9BACI|nr:alpha-mannosidase [Lederbergia galactosidilytica]MBP1913397.1 alpha-mannosidase [Lederbergia galactosidilytica]OAK71425.1 alpha-mannosidase [Lederbergia galactosidilytica]
MFLTENKFENRIRELADFRYRDRISIKDFMIQEDDGEIGAYPPGQYDPQQKMSLGDYWKGRDRYLWLHTTVVAHQRLAGKQLVGLFSFGRTGGGNNSGFESLLFVNGKPYQGVDSNHEEVLFDEAYAQGPLRLDFRLWSGMEGGGVPREQEYKLEKAEIAWLDSKVDNLFYTLYAAFEILKETTEADPAHITLSKLISAALKLIDWTEPGSEEFYQSCYEAEDQLMQAVEAIDPSSEITIHAVGHTHIDVAWLWRLKNTREKSARSFSTVLNLMKRFPEYLFLQTQPQLYEYIKADYPEIYEQMKAKIADGKWEAAGAMWLEADCNIPSGESLVRQILYGKEFFKKEFNADSPYLWLPDVFGYSWALPQILKKSGIKTMMTTKISWNQYNRMPHDTFYWKGIDGSEILTHFITTPEPWNGPDSWFYTYNGFITAKTVKGAWEGYRDKELTNDLLVSYGYGDGGGGVNRHMLEMRRRFDKLPGMPNVKTSTAGEFFEKLHANVKESDGYIHKWDGELYLEYHRGTYTSQAFMKQMNRQLELQYRRAEILTSWLSQTGEWQGNEALKEGWKIILRNQFHDIIPGSSITEVYEDARKEYEDAFAIVDQVEAEILSPLLQRIGQAVTLYNASHMKEARNVWIPEHVEENGIWKTADGMMLPAQKQASGWLVEVDSLPAFGAKTLYFEADAKSKETSPFQYKDKKLETPFYTVEFNQYGQISRLYDKEAERSILAEGENGNVLQIFEDKPLAHDAWDIDIFYQEKMEEIRQLVEFEVVENGSLAIEIQAKWHYHKSEFTQKITFYANERRIDFKTEADWHEKHKLLKTAFPVDIRATEATYDVQYGNVKRPNHWNTSWDMARFESVGHQWADLSEAGFGVSLLNDSKYGYDIKEHRMRLTLLKAATHPDPHADQGHHTFTYSLYPHTGDWREAKTVEKAWDLNDPVMVLQGEWKDENSFLDLHSDHVWVDAVKPAQDGKGVIVRVHEYEGRRGKATVQIHKPVENWIETNLMEESIGEEQQGSTIEFKIKPYEIKTFRLQVK